MSLATEAFATSKFVPESPSHWVSDESRFSCHDCHQSFNLLRRKHHCRSCSEVFCDSCTSYRLKARSKREPNLIVRVRVCKKCFDAFKGRKLTRAQSMRQSNNTSKINLDSASQSIKQSKTVTIKETTNKSSVSAPITESINQSKTVTTTTSLDGPAINVDTSINQSINGPIPVGKLSVVSHSTIDEEDDFYSDDETDHALETDDDSDSQTRSINQTVHLDSDKIPSINMQTVSKHDFFTIEEESRTHADGYEPKIESEERADKLVDQTVNLDSGKVDSLVFNQLAPMTLTGRTTINQMHTVNQQLPLLDLLNSKTDRSGELTNLTDKELISRSMNRTIEKSEMNRTIEKSDMNLDGAHIAPIVTTTTTHVVDNQSKPKAVFTMNLDSSNMNQNKIVVGPDTIDRPIIDVSINQSKSTESTQSVRSSQSKTNTLSQSTNQLTELDRPFSTSHKSIVSGPGAFSESISGPDVISDSLVHNPSITPSISQALAESDRAMFNQDAAEERLTEQQIDQSITYDSVDTVSPSIDTSIDSLADDSVLSTRSASPVGLAALPKQKSVNASIKSVKPVNESSIKPSTIKQSTNKSLKEQLITKPLDLSGDHSNAMNSGLPVPPACWPNPALVDEIENHPVSQSLAQSVVPAIKPNSQSAVPSIKPVAQSQSIDATTTTTEKPTTINTNIDDMWSPIGTTTSSSPLGLAAMKVSEQSVTQSNTNMNMNMNKQSMNQPSLVSSSSSGEFDPVTRKRKVKVRVLRGAQTSWRSRFLHPVPATMIVLLSVILSAVMLPGAVIGLVMLAAIAGIAAYFWPRVQSVITTSSESAADRPSLAINDRAQPIKQAVYQYY